MKKVGMVTGGGDAPALNAVIRASVLRLARDGVSAIGFLDGWRGVVNNNSIELPVERVANIISEGGTIIGSSRTNPYKNEAEDVPKILDTFKKTNIDALIAIGGDDTLGVADKLHKQHKLKLVGVPKTIDNDLSATDFTFGFYTAVERATQACDWLVTTARSHRRCLVVEVMGRHAGWIAGYAGLAAGADFTLLPEEPIDLDPLEDSVKRAFERQGYAIVVVSEGAKIEEEEITQHAELDDFGHVRLGGIAQTLAKMLEKLAGVECRHVVLGHLQRGGSPTAYDRILGTRYGHAVAELALKGGFGKMVALRGNDIVTAPLSEAVAETKTLDAAFQAMLKEYFS